MSDKRTTIHHFSKGDTFAEQGRFVLEGLLGVGGFADVYKARDSWSGLTIALKIYTNLNDDDILSLSKEYARMAHLNHDNILKADYFGSWGNVPYLMMQYCKGGSLDRRIGQLSESELAKMLLDVSRGLEYLHSRHIVHQDIKPANILMDINESGENVYKLSDFGISNKSKTQLSKSVRVAEHELSLTVAYAPPEKFSAKRADREADPSGDIYSFGLTIYEIITETLPFGEISTGNQMYNYPGTRIDLSEIPYPRMRWIVDSCVRRERGDRPTATQIQQMLMAEKSEIPEQYLTVGDMSPQDGDIANGTRYDEVPGIRTKKNAGTSERKGRESSVDTGLQDKGEIYDKSEKPQSGTDNGPDKLSDLHDNDGNQDVPVVPAVKKKKIKKVNKAPEVHNPISKGEATVKISTLESETKKRKNNWIPFVAIGCGVIVIAAVIVWFLTDIDRTESSDRTNPSAVVYEPEISTVDVNGIKVEMVSIPGGEVLMGYDMAGERAGKVSRNVADFSLGRTEVTQRLWKEVMGTNPSTMKGDNLPVNNISWDDCQIFIKKLNAMTGKNFYLPSEAEWEYAAKMQPGCEYSLYGGKGTDPKILGWYKDNSDNKIHEAGSLGEAGMNGFGLYDMSGNVIEWTQDVYSDYATGKPISGEGQRSLRGGYYGSDETAVRTTARGSYDHDKASPAFGLRIALK